MTVEPSQLFPRVFVVAEFMWARRNMRQFWRSGNFLVARILPTASMIDPRRCPSPSVKPKPMHSDRTVRKLYHAEAKFLVKSVSIILFCALLSKG